MHSRPLSRWILLIAVAAGTLVGCGEMRPIGERRDLILYNVEAGDTLYSIAWRYGYDHREIAGWNAIPPPYTIHVGQRLLIIPPYQATPREPPVRGTPPAADPSRNTTVVAQGAKIDRTPLPAVTKPTARSPSAVQHRVETSGKSRQKSSIDWRWPANGTLRNTFGPEAGRKGVDITGTLGQPVLAAAAGKVVYSGNGLIGYGNLVIIKHDDRYLSAYGHNRRLLVKEGSEVKQGEQIAEMGDSGKEGVVLHFEIRHDGKPVDPLRYLPKQGT